MSGNGDTHRSRPTRRSVVAAGGAVAGAALTGGSGLAWAAPASAEDRRIRLADNGHTRYQIYCGAGEDATVRHAADELAHYLNAITSARFPVVVSDDPPANPELLVVGRRNPLLRRFGSLDPANVGEDGFALRTRGRTALIAGVNSRGTLYGVYWLLDRVLGVRWFSADFTTVPHARTLDVATAQLNGDQTPRFTYRQMYAGDAADPAYRHHNLLNGNRGWDDADIPTPLDTWSTYWPASPFGGTWRTMVPDQSLWSGGQILAMDERTRQMAADNLVAAIRKRIADGLDPSIGFDQQDADWQPDPASKTFVDQHGGALSAAVVDLANDVVTRVRKQIPQARISTQAYWFSFTPPTGIKVDDAVVLTVAPIQANFAHSLFADDNLEIGRQIQTWCRLANNIVVWDYLVDFASYIQPFPDYWAMADGIRTMAGRPQVQGYFGEHAYNAIGSEFVHLRTWVLGRLLWDPHQDADGLIREFLNGYYGPAAALVHRYMRLLRQSVEDTGARLTFSASVSSPYLNFDTMVAADHLMAQAESAVRESADFHKHLLAVRLNVDYVILMRIAEFQRTARERGIDWDPDTANRLDRFEDEIHAAGLTRYSEGGGTPEDLLRQLRIATAPATPPATVAGLPPEDWADYQEPALRLYAPVITILDDPGASNGYTVRMPGNRPDWGVQLALESLPTNGSWKVYVTVRADTGSAAPDAAAMVAGVYPPFGNERTIKVSEVADGEYHELELPGVYQYDAANPRYAWISPPNSSAVAYVYVDRIFAVRA
ncbi:Glycosyl hydrolase family 67 N-terminus [Actinopolymorpha cephalotaxi]|uniref:Glycosyl hydrolase family 67 N-terminus n=1 Tax=Actinopolymorpha cephalotaxi TaxID=504797 RepID=A0A1I3B083_9ACTN|nr:DUF4838 domain-containing protein [Actinopolymorpha cephalotaxi]NYH84260.1 hypothetical protein [Actinopolymorpha cephalotaxi]SFH55758.1 Glycosyl hydrolase family 67 N-terminus [Actinopolymorpha cephalotaxi]